VDIARRMQVARFKSSKPRFGLCLFGSGRRLRWETSFPARDLRVDLRAAILSGASKHSANQ
jgi:hypothetical protein